MDESCVRGRLDRIGALDRASAEPGELLAELRVLLSEAERMARKRAPASRDGEEVVERPARRVLGT